MSEELNDLPFGIMFAFLANYFKKHDTTRHATDSKEYKDFVKTYKERNMKSSNKIKWETALEALTSDRKREEWREKIVFPKNKKENIDSCNIIPQSDIDYENIDSCTDELLEDEELAQIEGKIIQHYIDMARGK